MSWDGGESYKRKSYKIRERERDLLQMIKDDYRKFTDICKWFVSTSTSRTSRRIEFPGLSTRLFTASYWLLSKNLHSPAISAVRSAARSNTLQSTK